MMGSSSNDNIQCEKPEERAEGIFQRMDLNKDGKVTKAEFVKTCLSDQKLLGLLTPQTE